MTLTAPAAPALATERQVAFLRDLLGTRVAPEWVATTILRTPALDTLARAEASRLIDALLPAPRKSVEAYTPAASPARAGLAEALSAIPKSKYAVPAGHLAGALQDYTLTNDLLFVEVREYRGTLFMRRLSGAPGAFSRARFTARDTLAVARVLAQRPVEYITQFGQHYTCCGRCAAPLTDSASRARFLGPDCARQLGVL